jgi:hypothetical protein
MHLPGIAGLTSFQPRTNLLNVVIETSLGTNVKLKYDDAAGVFRAHKAMPVGFEFPFNFGFIPGTVAGDGDPLDVLLLSNHAMSAGTVVLALILSVLEAEQVESKKRRRNDRLICHSLGYGVERPNVARNCLRSNFEIRDYRVFHQI